ncbi:hypothetical protein HU200_001386 [Digitaria exilis]|uniref:Uncharacterized protein n=1 Tax=Digitaria exilis TaxID=1010633 RepID=A0A835FYW3_9POAL|nr:hypothetical protein HU200_001386 [Digitaria exilis]
MGRRWCDRRSAMVRLLGEAASPEEGLKKLEELART